MIQTDNDKRKHVNVVLEESTECNKNWEPIAGRTFVRSRKVFRTVEECVSWIESNPPKPLPPVINITREPTDGDGNGKALYKGHISYNDNGSHVDNYYKIVYSIGSAMCDF